MKFPLSFKVRNVRKLWSVEAPETANDTTHLNRGEPALAVSRFAYAEQTPRIVLLSAPLIFLVQALGGRAEVGEAVVVFAAVFMIEIFCWPQASVHRPSDAVRQQVLSVDGDVPVSFGVDRSRNIARSDNAAAVNFPNEHTRFGSVRKNLAQFGNGWKHTEIMA